jgi:single-strand DNA-binding protein
MNSFNLFAIGHLADDPERHEKDGKTYARFALIGNDFAGRDRDELTTGVFFVAFHPLGEAIATHARKGDQLIVEAQVRANNWTDTEGEKKYSYSFIVNGFRFGAPGKAKRERMMRTTTVAAQGLRTPAPAARPHRPTQAVPPAKGRRHVALALF